MIFDKTETLNKLSSLLNVALKALTPDQRKAFNDHYKCDIVLEYGRTTEGHLVLALSEDDFEELEDELVFSAIRNHIITKVNVDDKVLVEYFMNEKTQGLYDLLSGLEPVAPMLVSLVVLPNSLNMVSGTTSQLVVTAIYSDSTTQDVTTSAIYGTPDASVASVNSSGVITASGTGSVILTISVEHLTKNVTVSVT